MIITYEKEAANKELKRDYFTAYRWYDIKDSLILDQLWKVIELNDSNFNSLCSDIKQSYKNRTVKSRCDIYYTENTLEITTRGIFPKIIVYAK